MLKLNYSIKRWTMVEPFIIAGKSYDNLECVIVTLTDEFGNSGRGETCGVDYHGESVETICQQIDDIREQAGRWPQVAKLESGVAERLLPFAQASRLAARSLFRRWTPPAPGDYRVDGDESTPGLE